MKTIVMANLLTMVPMPLMFAGIGGGLVVAMFTFDDQVPGRPQLEQRVKLDPLIGVPLMVVGGIVGLGSAVWGLRNTTMLAGWYLKRLAVNRISARAERIVNPNDPAVIFVELVPRANWTRMMLETATDIGFLLLEEGRAEVLFEGDAERMRIPYGAILSCKVEETVIAEGTGSQMKYYFTVLKVRCDSGTVELPFAYRGDLGKFGAGVREKRARDLHDRIQEMCST